MSNARRVLEIAVEPYRNHKQNDRTPGALHPIKLSMSLQSEEQNVVGALCVFVGDA